MDRKEKMVFYLILLAFVLVWSRLFYLQVVSHGKYSELAQNQYQSLDRIIPKRGKILASDGSYLSLSSASSSASQYHRLFPAGSQSAYLTGLVGKDESGQDIGYFGLEGYYDRQLRGKPGRINQQTDVFNRPILIGKTSVSPAIEGSDLYTSIDPSVQHFAMQNLIWGLNQYQAAGGTITVMESVSGKILAMVSIPNYDPNQYTLYRNEIFKNPIITSGYEPGSTFKPLVMAAALDAKVININTICDICYGPFTIGDATIKSWNNQYYPQSTLFDIILHSDNVGMTFVSRKLGVSRLLTYLKDYGFGQKTGIDLQEESSPALRPQSQWYPIDLATASFGQGIAVTRLQMLTAFNSLANQGMLIPPSIVSRIQTGERIQEIASPKSRRVLSKEAVLAVVEMMRNGVEKGEVRYYKPLGYTFAGKTGTAQVPIAGHYDPNVFISSFIGFSPVEKPLFTMLVTLDNPQTSPWGSTTAAPLWFKTAEQILKYYRLPPKN